jgi:hypothetical protein
LFSRNQSRRLLRREHLQLAKISVGGSRRWIAAGAKQVRRLIVKAKRLHRGNHCSTATTRNQHCLLADLTRQRARERMLE